jgi:hypothetical protein
MVVIQPCLSGEDLANAELISLERSGPFIDEAASW